MSNYKQPPEKFTDLVKVGEAKAKKIKSAGYDSVDELKELSEDEIAEIEGIGPAVAGTIAAQLDDETDWPDTRENEANLSGTLTKREAIEIDMRYQRIKERRSDGEQNCTDSPLLDKIMKTAEDSEQE